jgi:hypothetical protein
VLRKSLTVEGPYEILTHLFHDLGIQSNILVSATYLHKGSECLTPAKLSAALLAVIHEHPALLLIGVTQPSEKKPGNHRLWETRLPRIIFEDCVEFINADLEGDAAVAELFKKLHNQWFDTTDQSKPWWKVTVINASHVIFLYHHSVADGLSGYTFHRSLLTALNENELMPIPTGGSDPETFESLPPKDPPPYPLEQLDDKLSWPYVIYCFLFWHLIRFFVNDKYFLFSDAVYLKTLPTVAKLLPLPRTVTSVEILRIDPGTMNKCLAACREHNTSFTALLHTLIQVTLASDVYAKAKFGFSRQAVNIRSLLKVDPGIDVFQNAASQYGRVQWLRKYRNAGSNTLQEQSSSNLHVDAALVWKLAADYKKGMNDFITSRKTVQDFLTGKLLGEDIEDVTFYGLALYQNNSFLISNLGVFEPRSKMADGGWSIQDVGFSAAAIRSAMGDIGMSFNVASAKNGGCLIAATYEEGVLKDEMVRRVLDSVLGRLKLLL